MSEKTSPADVKPDVINDQDKANLTDQERPNLVDPQQEVGLEPRSQKLYKASEVAIEMNKLNVKEIKNVSGNILLISDLYNEHSRDKEGLSLEPNEVIDLTDLFTAREINSSKSLREAIGLKDEKTNKPLYIAVLSTCDDPDNVKEVEDVNKVKLTKDGVDIFEAPRNEYDDRLRQVEIDEKERNKNQSQIAQR